MALGDRDYLRTDQGYGSYGGGQNVFAGVRGISLTTTLIIINCVVYFFQVSGRGGGQLSTVDQAFLMQSQAVMTGQIWRLWTSTFLHWNTGHLLVNMLGLYFFGRALEQVWGKRQFFLAYTVGGVVGNILLLIAGMSGIMSPQTLGMGASGSILTLVGASAVLFPDAKVLIYFLLPVNIRIFAAVFAGLYIMNIVTRGDNWGGDVAHLSGLIVGLWWAYSGGISLSGRHRTHIDSNSMLGRLFGGSGQRSQGSGGFGGFGGGQRGRGAWERKLQRRRKEQMEVDRILAKVHEHGVGSLTRKERKTLEEDTRRRQTEDRRTGL
jgi:membrane associated rhomboid family serine protease